MLSVFDYTDYRKFLSARIRSAPKQGYGQAKKLAEHLSVSTTLISHVLTGTRDLTLEQAMGSAQFFGLTKLETEYFLAILGRSRAGTEALRRFYDDQVYDLKKKSNAAAGRLDRKRNLSEQEKAVFYSDWFYSAARLLTSISSYSTVEKIGERLDLDAKHVNEALQFLVKTGLVVEERKQFKMGPSSTHLEPESPWIKSLHTNWRLKAVESLQRSTPEKLHYTSPMTLSKKDADTIRGILLATITSISQIVDPSPEEELYCINVDWFQV